MNSYIRNYPHFSTLCNGLSDRIKELIKSKDSSEVKTGTKLSQFPFVHTSPTMPKRNTQPDTDDNSDDKRDSKRIRCRGLFGGDEESKEDGKEEDGRDSDKDIDKAPTPISSPPEISSAALSAYVADFKRRHAATTRRLMQDLTYYRGDDYRGDDYDSERSVAG